eukprot:TRINITY_DN7466_c0_g1_i9.p1 TRINITY_DN7466_c0_g1~~TRINITY_DN7466_c0_g1_i9.p1  ORF type:complete len:121 (+),score=12.64 TRINITY_DN7466_c0_g1_i9:363-725(+)
MDQWVWSENKPMDHPGVLLKRHIQKGYNSGGINARRKTLWMVIMLMLTLGKRIKINHPSLVIAVENHVFGKGLWKDDMSNTQNGIYPKYPPPVQHLCNHSSHDRTEQGTNSRCHRKNSLN